MGDMEERSWKSGLRGRGQREWISDVSDDQEITCLRGREERKSGLSLQEGEQRDSCGVSMCLPPSKCHIDTRDPTRSYILQEVEQDLTWLCGSWVCTIRGRSSYSCVVYSMGGMEVTLFLMGRKSHCHGSVFTCATLGPRLSL